MENRIFEISWLGPIKAESCPDVNPYPVRPIVLRQVGKFGYDQFVGYVYNEDALKNLHVGDLISVSLSFFVHKNKGVYYQDVYFSNLKKIKEIE